MKLPILFATAMFALFATEDLTQKPNNYALNDGHSYLHSFDKQDLEYSTQVFGQVLPFQSIGVAARFRNQDNLLGIELATSAAPNSSFDITFLAVGGKVLLFPTKLPVYLGAGIDHIIPTNTRYRSVTHNPYVIGYQFNKGFIDGGIAISPRLEKPLPTLRLGLSF